MIQPCWGAVQSPSVAMAALLRPQTAQLLTALAGHSNTEIARFITYLCGLVSMRSPPPEPTSGAMTSN